MSKQQDGDVITTSAAENVAQRLGLKYENVMSPIKAIRITLATMALFFAILWFQKIQTEWDVFKPLTALIVYVRLTLGSPMERQLTAESRKRLSKWLASEAVEGESSHAKTDE